MRRVFYVVVFIAFSSFHVGEAAESSSCQTLVFSGLSTSCNLNGGQSSSEDACCRALDTANAKRCFCDEGLMTTIKLVIGDNGIQFFRDFAIGSCSGELTEGEACVDGDGDDESEWDGVIAPPPPMDHTHRDLELSEIDYYTRDVRGSPPPDRRPTPLFPTRAPPERETIANFILDPRRDAEIGFTADALTLTGVRNELDSNQTSHTVFVPTNEAWYALLFRLGVTKEELFADANWLADALRYHTVRGIAHTSNIGFGTSLLTDLDDEELHVESIPIAGVRPLRSSASTDALFIPDGEPPRRQSRRPRRRPLHRLCLTAAAAPITHVAHAGAISLLRAERVDVRQRVGGLVVDVRALERIP